MSYNSYLMFLSQISGGRKAKIDYQENQVFIEKGKKKNQWTLSTPVFRSDGDFPLQVREALSAAGTFRWQEGDAYLKLDSHQKTIFLIQSVHTSMTFIPFKEIMNNFVFLADEWREIFDGFSSDDTIRYYSC